MSHLERKLSAREFVVTAEMPVIDGGGFPEIQRQLAPMQAYLDAVNATDNTSAHAHAAPLAVAIALKSCGIEPIMQLVCRDRNRLALQADIVGAAMHGIENICVPDRRRRHRRRRARGAPRVRPRRAAAHLGGHHAGRWPLPVGSSARARAAAVRRRRRVAGHAAASSSAPTAP